MSDEQVDYLEVDNPIPGQNYVCLSFVSPETVLADKQLWMFNKYMSQRCAEFEQKLTETLEKGTENLSANINDDLVKELHESMRFSYESFKSKFDDFKYKFNDQLENQYNKYNNFKTSVRGVKVRGTYDTYNAAQNKARELQRQDRSFHIFVGQVGSWLPWDPCADKVTDEEYLEDELNTMMRKYKENQVSKDLFYEEQKREKVKAAMEERLANEKKQKELQESLEEEDPWLKSKFTESPAITTDGAAATDDAATDDAATDDAATDDAATDDAAQAVVKEL